MLSVKQGGIKYYFLNLWYNSTKDWILVSRTIGEHSTHKAKRKDRQIPGSCQRIEKIEEHEGDGDTNCSWYTWNGL